MSNMSYCRFRNTYSDLRDCRRALQELDEGNAPEGLSAPELEAAGDLLAEAVRVIEMLSTGMEEWGPSQGVTEEIDIPESFLRRVPDYLRFLSERAEEMRRNYEEEDAG